MHKAAVLLAAFSVVAASTGAAPDDTQKIVFARVFPNAGQVGLFLAAADGTGERPLVGLGEIDYDPVWSPDGASIVFTSDREGSAELFRVKPDGTELERLTSNPAYDDQAAFSPDGRKLVFVSTRIGGRANLWTLDLQTRRATRLTTGAGGDFRPSWSPNEQWIAFSSDRDSTLPFASGRWEHLQTADVYVVHPDGTGLKRIGEHGNFCGSPKFSADSRRVVAYCMDAELTLEARRFSLQPADGPRRNLDTRLVSIDLATGAAVDVAAGPGMKYNPSFLPGTEIGYIRKDGPGPGIYYTGGRSGPKGDVRAAAWSPDGKRVAFHRRLTAPPTTWVKAFSRKPRYALTLTGILPAFNATGDRFVMTGRPNPGDVLGASLQIAKTGSNEAEVIYQDKSRNIMAPSWSASGDKILFGVGVYNLFFNGFNGTVFKSEDRIEGGAQIATVNPDGTGYQEVTSGPNNNGFPSMAPDGTRIVFRSFGPDGEGLRIMNLETKAITTLTEGYDNFPLWSPRGDLIMFSRAEQDDYEIYTIKPDGTGVKRLTFSKGNDAHMAWSPDGEHIVFASTRTGFKDEGTYTDAPQPYGELFVMRYDGTVVEQLTDNQWEDGTPAWQPTGRVAAPR
jgi:Tol biopolymer transport system component